MTTISPSHNADTQASGGLDQSKPQAANSCCVQPAACTSWNGWVGLFDFKWIERLLDFILWSRVIFSFVMADAGFGDTALEESLKLIVL